MTLNFQITGVKSALRLFLTALVAVILWTAATGAQTNESLFKGKGPWYEQTPSGDINLHLYFFWSKECPHCRRAKPFLEKLQDEHPWVLLQQKEVTEFPENKKLFGEMMDSLGETSRAVPTLMFCGGKIQGFDKAENSGKQLTNLLTDCRKQLTAYLAPPDKMPEIPSQKTVTQSNTGSIVVLVGILISSVALIVWRSKRVRK